MPFGNAKICVWHIPKSGGTWLREALTRSDVQVKNIGKPHDTVHDYPKWESHQFHAVIVRDVIAWYSSTWRWMRKNGMNEPLAQLFHDLDKADMNDFAQFMVRHVGSYTRAIKAYSPPGCHVIRTERMTDDTSEWLHQCGIHFVEAELHKLPPMNVTEEQPPIVPPTLERLIRTTEFCGENA